MTSAPITLTVYVMDDHQQKVAINDKIFGVGKSWQEAFLKMIDLPNFGGVITDALVAHNIAETEKRLKPVEAETSHAQEGQQKKHEVQKHAQEAFQKHEPRKH